MVFFGFHQRPNKKTKNLVIFGFSTKNPKTTLVIFWISFGKPKKTLAKPKHPKASRHPPKARQNKNNTTIQNNLCWGAQTFGFFGFPRFFGFSTETPKKHLVFLGFPKNTGFLSFSPETEQKTPKTPSVFFGFPPKIQEKPCDFSISVGKPKNPRKTKNPKVSGPSQRIWIFYFCFLVSAEGTTKTKNQKI